MDSQLRNSRTSMSFSEIAKAQDTNRTQPKKAASNGVSNLLQQFYRFVPNLKISMFLVVILQIVILYLFLNPINVLNQLKSVQILNEVSKLANVPPAEIPQMSVIGDNNIPNAEDLKKANAITAEIYKDANDGDYILLYTNKLVVYSVKSGKIIYDGDTPNAIADAQSKLIIEKIITKAKESGIVSSDYAETPQIQVVTDAELVKQGNPTFYQDLAVNDIIATFVPVDGKSTILIYRPASDIIIRTGNISIETN